MFGQVIENTVFLVNLCLLVQVVLSVDQEIPVQEPNIPATLPEGSHLNQEQLEQLASIQPNGDDIQINKEAFKALQHHFGTLGPLMYDAVTNENALGEEFARISKIILSYIKPEKYRHSLDVIIERADSIDFAGRLKPLFAKIAEIQDPKTNETFGQAVETITNILSDPKSIDDIRQIITSPTSIPKQAIPAS